MNLGTITQNASGILALSLLYAMGAIEHRDDLLIRRSAARYELSKAHWQASNRSRSLPD